jgi:hypothetical protein
MTSRLDSRQSRQRAKLDQLSTATDLRLDSLLNLINDELTMPLRMRANLGSGVDGSPNQNLYVDGVSVQTYDSGAADSGHERNRTILPISGTIPNYSGGGYVSFTQASPGGAISFAGTGLTLTGTYSLTMTANQFVKILVWINANNEFGLEIGTPSSTLVGASIPEFPLDAFALGFLVLTTNSSAVISKVLNENIYQFANNGNATNGSSVSKVISQANTFAVGDVVYLNGTIYQKAQANSSTTSEAVGIVSKASSTKFTLTEIGYVKNLSGLVAGGVYFLSDSVAGGLTINEPVVLGSVSKPMLIADTTTSGYVLNYRGVIVGGTNARTQINLSATTSAQAVYIAPVGLNAGELTGWVYLDATTDLKFYVSAKFVKTGDNSNWNISPTYVGETPPPGFSMTITSGGAIQITMNPLPSGFVSGYINYAVDAPSVGATYPLSIDVNTIVGTMPISKGGTGQTTASAAINALLPAQGSSANKYLKTDGSNVSWATAQSSSGEINSITNSSGADGLTTDWVVGTVPTTSHSIAVASGAAMPLFPNTNTAFAISSSAAVAIGSQSNLSGVYDSFTMAPGLRNRKLKVEFYFNTPVSTDGTWAVAVYSGSTKVVLTTDTGTPKDTILPANVTGGKFVAYFDTDSSTTYSLNFVQRTRVNPNTFYVTNVIVGPGIQPQGAVVGEWTNFTPVNGGTVSYSALTGRYRRVGDSAQIRISGTINAGAVSTYLFDMPTSIGTIDTTKVRNGNYQDQYGVATYYRSPTINYAGIVQKTNVANRVRVVGPSGGNEWSQGTNTPVATTTGDGIELEFTVPIAEWAGSGTVQLAQNDVEYAFNSSTSATTDSSSFGYGPAGVGFQAFAPTLLASVDKRVRFQTPIQPSDVVTVEMMDPTTNFWSAAATRTFGGFSSNDAATTYYGITINDVSGSTTDLDVNFYSKTANKLNLWSELVGPGWKWRVRKSSAGAAVGFGIVSGSSAGLLPASNSNLDDATATRLGLKQYVHGTAYNGGIAPTLTSAQAGFSVAWATFIPYQMQDGGWRLKFSFRVGFTSASVTAVNVALSGITFPATFDFFTGYFLGSSQILRGVIDSPGSVPSFSLASTVATTAVGIGTAGDVALSSKPTWAY